MVGQILSSEQTKSVARARKKHEAVFRMSPAFALCVRESEKARKMESVCVFVRKREPARAGL